MQKLWSCGVIVILGLVGCQQQEPLDIGWIEVTSEPDGAQVYLDDTLTTQTTGCIIDSVPEGEHVVRVSLAGYIDQEDTVTVEVDDTVTVVFTLSESGLLLWKYKLLTMSMSGYPSYPPALSHDGNIYWSSGELFAALTPDGSLIWEASGGYPSVAPDGTIYVIGVFLYLLTALDPDGSVKWEADFVTNILMSPAVGSDGTIYAGARGEGICSVSSNGDRMWTYDRDYYTACVISSDENLLVLYADDFMLEFSPEGELLNEIQLEFDAGLTSPYWNDEFALGEDGAIYISRGTDLYAFDPDGSKRWKYTGDGEYSQPPVIGYDGTIYYPCGQEVLAITEEGNLNWKYDVGADPGPLSVGSDGTIYLSASLVSLRVDSSGSTIDTITDTLTWFYGLGPDGSLQWEHKDESFGLGTSAPAIANGVIYYGSVTGNIYAFSCNSFGLGSSPWPTYRHDNQRTGRTR